MGWHRRSESVRGAIINLAPSGMVPTGKDNPRLPVSVAEMAADVASCVALGANLVHLHARDDDGQPTYRKDAYARLIGAIRERCPDTVICVSLSGRRFPDFAQRAEVLELRGDLQPDMASLTLSSLNFRDGASVNSPEMIQRLAARMAETGVRPELEVFDSGMLNYACYLVEKGFLQPPHYFNLILGGIASAQATPGHLNLLMNELPPGSIWCGGGVGRAQLFMNTMGLLCGSGVRVGLEDNLWLDADRTVLASNGELVARAVELARLLGRQPAAASTLRTALGLRDSPG